MRAHSGNDRKGMAMVRIERRQLLMAAALLPLAGLAACVTGPGGYSLEEVVRRLLTLSSERAFARLLAPGGFYEDELARIAVPEGLGGGRGRAGAILGAVLNTRAVRRELELALNDVAGQAADRATPVVMDAIGSMSMADAVRVLRGGPQAATDLLRDRAGGAVVDALLPGIGRGMGSDAAEVLSAAMSASTGVDPVALYQTVADRAAAGIFRAIGREEAAIRANPEETRDPMLIALLGHGRQPNRGD